MRFGKEGNIWSPPGDYNPNESEAEWVVVIGLTVMLRDAAMTMLMIFCAREMHAYDLSLRQDAGDGRGAAML